MSQSGNSSPQSPNSHLHSMNLIVALLAGVISITGGIYSLKNNLFSGPSYGSLQGIVRDERIARPLKLAAVEISDLAGAVVNTATTDDNGHYLIESLKTGNYVVKFAAPLHKVETKTIKVEKDLVSSINVDLVPEAQPPVQGASLEIPVARTITPYTPVTTYPTATPAASSYNAGGTMSSGTNVPPTYAPSNVPMQQDPSSNSQYSGYHRRHPRRYPGEYDPASSTSTSSSGSQGSTLATAGAQLLQVLMTKKSEDTASTTSSDGSSV